MIKAILLVGFGGAVGSVMRYLLSVLGANYFKGTFPIATFITNFLGCLIIGLLIGYFGKNTELNPQLKLLLITGFCGGFTTFSTFTYFGMTTIMLFGFVIFSVIHAYVCYVFGEKNTYIFYEYYFSRIMDNLRCTYQQIYIYAIH
jgi:protein CrcB